MSGLHRGAGALLLAVGCGLAVWTLWVAGTEGIVLTPATSFVSVTALSLAALGIAQARGLGSPAAWAALSVVGFATTLQLVEAGGAVAYQHLRPALLPLAPGDAAVLSAMAAQGCLAALGLRTHLWAIRSWIGREVGWARGVALLVALAAVSASPLRDVRGYALEVLVSTSAALVALATLGVTILELPAGALARLRALAGGLGSRLRARGLDTAVLAVAVAVACALLARFVYEGHPHVSDEFGFLFQAIYFASGSLTAPGVPVPELFESYQIECSVERCISVLQPGWPALLAVGAKAGLHWLVNPILAGVNVWLAAALVRELYGARLALVSAALMATSPWFLFLGMSLMNHHATLCFALVGVLGATVAVRRGRAGWALLAGAGVGLTSLMRPMDGVIAALLAGVPLALQPGMRRRVSALALYGVGVAATGSLNLAYNRATTGAPLEFAVSTYVDELWGEGSNSLGFGPEVGNYPQWAHMDALPGHSPLEAVINAVINFSALNVDLFGWAIGSLVPLLLFASWGRFERPDRWLLLAVTVIVAFYSLYWFASGPDFAARYWFLAVVPLVVLTARSLVAIGDRLGPGRGAIAPAMALLIAHSLLVFVPWRSADKYHRYIGTGPSMREVLEREAWPADVFVVRGANHPDFAGAMIYRAPDLAGPGPVIAFDTGFDVRGRLERAFPGRRLWLVDGPGRTGDVYRVVGPLP